MRQGYDKQVRLLLMVLPVLSVSDVFALKGGTAINFFIRDFPRLSVDIDLTYLPVKNRSDSLEEIKTGVLRIGLELEKQMPGVLITRQKSGGARSEGFCRGILWLTKCHHGIRIRQKFSKFFSLGARVIINPSEDRAKSREMRQPAKDEFERILRD